MVHCLFANAREGLRKASVPGADQAGSDAASQRGMGMYVAHVALTQALTHLHVRDIPQLAAARSPPSLVLALHQPSTV